MPNQPQLRELLKTALEQHRWMAFDMSWDVCTGSGGSCNWRGKSKAAHAEHLTDVLLSLPGIAVVDVPAQVAGFWPVVVTGEPEQVYLSNEPESWADPERIVCISGMGYIYVDEARSLAAALLAAAAEADHA